MTSNELQTAKTALLDKCSESRNAHLDRTKWMVCVAKKNIRHRGVQVLEEGELVLFDPTSFGVSELNGRKTVTVYLSQNIGGVNTTRYVSEFHFFS